MNTLSPPIAFRPTCAAIDLGALEANLRASRTFIGNAVDVMAVVKADAYGHGAVRCAERLVKAGASWLAVALPEEGVQLRDAGITAPILCLGGFWPGQGVSVLRHDLTPAVFTREQLVEIAQAAVQTGRPAGIHLKIDTGMGRIGVPFDDLRDFLLLTGHENVRIDGLMTHFAAADDLGEVEFTQSQIEKFSKAEDIVREAGHQPEVITLANSPGAVVHHNSRRSLVRLGGILYGLGRDVIPAGVERPKLRNVMSVTSTIGQLKSVPAGCTLGYGRTYRTRRPSVIATVGIGYHDGFPRALSNKGEMIVRGTRVPVVGRVSMDWTLIDVTDVLGVTLGDHVTVIGQDGDELILAEDIAQQADTISYEITCGIGPRVSRQYVG